MHITDLKKKKKKRFGWVGKIQLSWICYSAWFYLFWITLILGKGFIACHDKLRLLPEAAQKPLYAV